MTRIFLIHLIANAFLINATIAAEVDFDGRTKNSTSTALNVEFYSIDSSSSKISSRNNLSEARKVEAIGGDYLRPISAPDATNFIVEDKVCGEDGKCVEPKYGFDSGVSESVYRGEYTFNPGNLIRRSFVCSKGKWDLKLEYVFDSIAEGHEHKSTPFPPLSLYVSTDIASPAQPHGGPSPISLSNLQTNTTYYIWTRLPAFATTLKYKYVGTGACAGTLTDLIHARILGLTELPPEDHLFFPDHQTGFGHDHMVNHYGSQRLINAITAIATEYTAAYPKELLRVYDMSLPYGGIIDVNYDWKSPFYGHTTGIDADISKWRVPLENRQKLLEILCRYADTYSEQDVPGQPSYFHIRVPNAAEQSTADNFEKAPKTTIRCCNGSSVNPETLEGCISTKTVRK